MGQLPRAPALLMVLLITACGGGDDDRLSPQEFREQADALCVTYYDEAAEIDPPSTLEEVPGWAEELGALQDRSVDDLRALRPPEEFADRWEKILDLIDENRARLTEIREAAERGDEETVLSLIERGEATSDAILRLDRELGLDECAEGPQDSA
jgi:hypothetical protein